MKAKLGWWLVGAAMWIMLAGCESPPTEPNEMLAAQLRQNMAAPTVSGPHGDVAVKGTMSRLTEVVRKVLRDAKVHIDEVGTPGAGKWLLGKSLAGRKVLVEIMPLLPERAIVRITVEGGDQLTEELLDHLSQEISRKTR